MSVKRDKKIKCVYKMTQYIDVYVNISERQKQKLQKSIDAGCAIMSLRFGKDDLEGEHKLALTKAQHNKLNKAIERNKGITFRMSKKQLQHNIKVEGGFLGLLAGLAAKALPMIAKTVLPALGVGALSELASWGYKKLWDRVFTLRKEGWLAKWKRMAMVYI